MKSFFDLVPGADWGGRNEGCLHVYLLPGPAVRDMAGAYQRLFDERGIDGVSRQPLEHLHVTVEKLLCWADDITREQTAQLVDALAARLATVPAWTAQVGPALVAATSISLDITPDEPWQQLRAAVRGAAVEALGPDAVPAAGHGRPHISLGYGLDAFDMDPHLAAINGLRLGRADMAVDRAVLVAVDQDRQAGAYTWPAPIAEIPLGPWTPG